MYEREKPYYTDKLWDSSSTLPIYLTHISTCLLTISVLHFYHVLPAALLTLCLFWQKKKSSSGMRTSLRGAIVTSLGHAIESLVLGQSRRAICPQLPFPNIRICVPYAFCTSSALSMSIVKLLNCVYCVFRSTGFCWATRTIPVCVYHGQVLVTIQVDTKSTTNYLYQRRLSLDWIMLWVVTPRLIDSG